MKSTINEDGRASKPSRSAGPAAEVPIITSRAGLAAVMRELADEGIFSARETIPRAAYSIDEWGFAYGMSGPKVRHLIRAGMPSIRVGAQTRIIPGEALAWLKEHGHEVSLMSKVVDGGE